jgi:hypothetical protein
VIAWSSQSGQFVMFWQDLRSGSGYYEIWGAKVAPLGSVSAFSAATATNSFVNETAPALVESAGGFGLSWTSSFGLSFMRLDDQGVAASINIPLSNGAASAIASKLVWTGAEYGAFYADNRTGAYALWLQRVSAAGTTVGANQQISTFGLTNPAAAFGKHGYLVEGASISSPNDGLVMPWGCGTDFTAPSCPGNFFSYSVTGTTASVSWSPSGDNESDLAYYNVYRNNTLIAKTSSAYYNDTGLGLSTTYNYMVQPVNAWQLQNYTCTSAIYLTTNSSLTLTMSKSDPAAVLNWTDVGASGYKIFRGNDPHVMGQIASSAALTAQDGNALSDGNSYFYSVDE